MRIAIWVGNEYIGTAVDAKTGVSLISLIDRNPFLTGMAVTFKGKSADLSILADTDVGELTELSVTVRVADRMFNSLPSQYWSFANAAPFMR